jgi:hypothetical protein
MMLAVTLLGATPVAAEFFTGNQLHEFCNGGPTERNPSLCFGYIIGVAGAVDGKSFFCFSAGVKARQVEDVVKNFLKDHAEKRHDAASSLVITALKEKFPCN